MAISTGPTHTYNEIETKKFRIGLVATLSAFIALLWVLLAPIFSYEPISLEVHTPPGTQLASVGSSDAIFSLHPPSIG